MRGEMMKNHNKLKIGEHDEVRSWVNEVILGNQFDN